MNEIINHAWLGMTEPALHVVEPVPAVGAPKPAKPRQRALGGGMPRRYKDHRRQVAKRYRELYDQVIEQHPPKTRMGHWVAALAVDLMLDYENIRRSKAKGARSQRRKLTGLIFGAWRECRTVASLTGRAEADTLAALLAEKPEA